MVNGRDNRGCQDVVSLKAEEEQDFNPHDRLYVYRRRIIEGSPRKEQQPSSITEESDVMLLRSKPRGSTPLILPYHTVKQASFPAFLRDYWYEHLGNTKQNKTSAQVQNELHPPQCSISSSLTSRILLSNKDQDSCI